MLERKKNGGKKKKETRKRKDRKFLGVGLNGFSFFIGKL